MPISLVWTERWCCAVADANGDQVIEAEVNAIVAALARGEVVAIPTDTVYGLAADPRSPDAMAALFALKQRPVGVPIAVLVSSIEMAKSIVKPTRAFDELAAKHWPGALTIVAEEQPDLGLHIGSTENATGVATVGVRVPDHGLIQRCASAFGPIAATSANVHGTPTITDPREVRDVFGQAVNVVIDGGVLEGLASTVVDVTGPEVVILRQGIVQVA